MEHPAHFFIRSAAIEIGSSLVLLVAKPTTETTMLSMALVARGHRLFGGDRIAVDSENGNCAGLGRVPCVPFDFAEIKTTFSADQIASSHLGLQNNSIRFVSLPDQLVAPAGLSRSASALVVLERADQPTDTTILPAKKAEMLKALIPLHYGNTLKARAAFDALEKCVDHAQLFRLRYSDMERAADVLEQQFSQGPLSDD